jgi:hypothetical protein
MIPEHVDEERGRSGPSLAPRTSVRRDSRNHLTRLEDTMKDEKKVKKLLLTRETLRRLTDQGADRIRLQAGIRTGMRADTADSECNHCPPTTDCLGC